MRLVRGDIERVDPAAFRRSGVLRHHPRVKFLAQPPIDMRRQFHAGRGQRIDGRAEPRQRIDEGMDGAAAFEIAGDRDLHAAEVLVLGAQREQIAQRLRRMFVRAVAAVDDGNLRIFRRQARGAVARMADDDDVGVVGDDADRVGEAFALGGGADGRIGAGNIGAAEAQHRAFERQARAGRGLVEQAGENEFRGEVGAARDAVGDVVVGEFLQKPLGDLEDRFDLLIGQVVDRDDVARQRLGFGH